MGFISVLAFWGLKGIHGSANSFYNIEKGRIAIAPLGDWFAIFGEYLEFTEGGAFPVTGAQNDWNDAGIACIMTLNGSLHLDVVAIIGCHDGGTDEQQDYLC
jgi:hypothetical protein